MKPLAVQILFHGTGARRRESIEQLGLQPKVDSYVYASSNPLIAAVFAAARSTEEDDWGLVVAFKANGNFEEDPKFAQSVRSKSEVPAADIVNMQVIDPDTEIEAYNFLKKLVDQMKIRLAK
jgi:hypothetical protein